MLYLNPKEIAGVTLFPDDLNPSRYYYLPQAPQISRKKNGQLEIRLLKFQDQGMVGGLLTVQVDLNLDAKLLDNVRNQLETQAIRQLEPVPFVNGSASLVVLDKKSAPIRPALVGDNQATFSIELTQKEVVLLEHSFTEAEFPPIGVFYELEYLVLRPAYAFRLQADWNTVHRRLEEKFGLNLIFIKVEIENIFDELIRDGVIKVQSDTFAPENEDTNDMIRNKNRMLAEIQELMLNAFFETVVEPIEIKEENDVLSFLPGFGYKVVEITKIDRRSLDMAVNEQSIVRRRVHPQGQLQTKLDPKCYVTPIDLEDPYFRTRQVEIICRADLKQDAIQSVDVTLAYGGDSQSVRFESASERQTLAWNTILSNHQVQREVKAQYTVYFKSIPGITRPFSLASAETTTIFDYLEVFPRELYTIQPIPIITLATFPWARYNWVQVKVRYADTPNEIRLDKTFFLDQTAPQRTWQMFLRDRNQPDFHYQLRYNGSDGHKDVTTPWFMGQDQIIVRDPFPQQRVLTVIPLTEWTDIREVSAELIYQDSDNDIDERLTLWFSAADTAAKTFSANLRNPNRRLVLYQVTLYFKDNNFREIPWSTTLDKRLLLDQHMVAQRIVTLQAQDVDFVTYQIAEIRVSIKHADPKAGGTSYSEFIFNSSDDQAHFQFSFHDETNSGYLYQVVYFYTNGQQARTEWLEADADLLRLEARTLESFLVREIAVSAQGVDWRHFKSLQLKLRYEDASGGLQEKTSLKFDEESDLTQYWGLELVNQDSRRYHWQMVITMQARAIGNKGKVYWPGPAKDAGGSTEADQFTLSRYLPTMESLVQEYNLLLVEVSTLDLDWDAVKTINLMFQHKETKRRFRLKQDDAPSAFFLAPLADNVLSDTPYRWKATFTMQEPLRGHRGKIYTPGPTSKDWAESTKTRLLLKNYLISNN
ncbi:MAG: hypothetical protein AAF702_41870 [Chloroflexota bacterium]